MDQFLGLPRHIPSFATVRVRQGTLCKNGIPIDDIRTVLASLPDGIIYVLSAAPITVNATLTKKGNIITNSHGFRFVL